MPRRKGICRELKCLTATSGNAGHMFDDTTEWMFDCNERSIVTLAVGSNLCTNDNECSGSNGDVSEDEEISNASEDEGMLFDSSDDESVDTVARMSTSKVEDGNRRAHYPPLVTAIHAIVCCRCCVTNDWSLFQRFCDEKCDEKHSNSLNKRNKLNYL
jgi:hypothetical protein